MSNVIRYLKSRGLFEAESSPQLERAADKPLTVYAGFDPSSESLQAGNYVTIRALTHFQRFGHRVIALVGGATGMIGDPSGKSEERSLLNKEAIERNTEGIRENLSRFLDFDDPKAPAAIVNNLDWTSRLNVIDYLREIGKNFRMGVMLGKDSVRNRLESEAGMSYTEFSYQILQANDFLHLYDRYGCTLQVGGADQWGNITAGTDLIRKMRGIECFGFTFPLVCDSKGEKFGKSAGNAIYLDQRKTSYYAFYQFFLRAADADVIRYLRIFTALEDSDIEALSREMQQAPERRAAQRVLAETVTRHVHGEQGLAIAQRASDVLFGGDMAGLDARALLDIFADVPSAEIPRDEVAGANVLDLCVRSGLTASKGVARRLIESGGLYVNNERVASIDQTIASDRLVNGRVLVLRSGKKTFFVVRCV